MNTWTQSADSLVHVLPEIIEGEEFMINTAANH